MIISIDQDLWERKFFTHQVAVGARGETPITAAEAETASVRIVAKVGIE